MVCLQKSYREQRLFHKIEGEKFLQLNLLLSTFSLLQLLRLFLLSSSPLEPPEANIDNEHDEKDTSSCQFSIGGAGVQVLGVAPVLL